MALLEAVWIWAHSGTISSVQSMFCPGTGSALKILLYSTEGGMNICHAIWVSGSPVTTACQRRQSALFRISSRWPAFAHGPSRGRLDLGPLRHNLLGPEHVLSGDGLRAEDPPVQNGGRDEHLPRDLGVRVAGDHGLPEEAVRPLQDLLEVALRQPARLLGLVALRYVDDHACEIPLAGARGPDPHLLGEPVNGIGAEDAVLLLVSAFTLSERLGGGLLRPLVVGGLLVPPKPPLVDEGCKSVDGVLVELRRRPELPCVRRALSPHPRPPEQDV